MPYVLSTLTAGCEYTCWKTLPNGELRSVGSVTIQGGANVPNKHFVTLEGVLTEVTREELEMLKENVSFQEHLERGFVKIQVSKSENTKGLEDKDASAPLVPDDYKKRNLPVPETSVV